MSEPQPDEQRWQRIEALLDGALALHRAEVPGYLDGACGGDDRLRAEVEALLAAEAEADTEEFLETPAGTWLDTTLDEGGKGFWDDQLAGRQLGPYQLVRRIGRGGMGTVYEARDSRLDRRVAIKVLSLWAHDDHAKERFIREARAASAFDHPNICTVHDIGETEDGRVFIVMAYYDGETLGERLAGEPLAIDEAVGLAAQIGGALACAHRAGIVHRDVKPANVIITPAGTVKILDFGIASMADDLGLTRTGASVGTPAYMSPEQARGEAVDARADIWALGAVLYEMLAGRRPFDAENSAALLQVIQNEEPVPLAELRPEVPAAVAGAVRRALAKDREARTASVEELLGDLGAGAVETATGAAGTGAGAARRPARSAARSAIRSRWLATAAVIGLLLGAVGLVSWLGSPGSQLPTSATDGDLLSSPHQLDRRGAAALARYWQPGQIAAAVESYQRAVALDADRASSYAGLARALWRQYRADRDRALLDRAESNARRAVELDEHLTDGRVTLGSIRLAQGHNGEALDLFTAVLRLDPDNADAHRGLGDIAALAGETGEAEGAYRKALALRPDDLELHSLLGALYFRAARYGEAEEEFRHALELDPQASSGYKNLAAVLHMQGRYAEAARLLQQALAIQPEEEVYTNLGTLYYFQGLYPQALSAFEKAVELTPGDHRVWANLGDAHRRIPGGEVAARDAFRTGLAVLDESLDEELDQSLGDTPGDPALLALAAEYRAKLGDEAAARDSLDRLDRSPGIDSVSLFNATQAAEIAGQRERALAYLERALAAGYSQIEVSAEPDLAELRQDRRYRELVARLP